VEGKVGCHNGENLVGEKAGAPLLNRGIKAFNRKERKGSAKDAKKTYFASFAVLLCDLRG
jgi:hypothetical protein